ncbi:MAG: translation elongation factor Ts [Planctomycetes bacterium]|jgi:elongation factor Ts|nr:translation elongation factor Ts [Planctomycetota bacterium]MBT4028634.1 translation elongation factor Ts [Planctomycetota bacterium]MBT4559526.1 translation elongation factor Ts [Planctomycetota bacterium]MBT5101630.1 translation elongation factor Ts [Planctomycetota bacterium]MBT5119716.1 translation elongation factor Ts [Planctomycetota bacterium]
MTISAKTVAELRTKSGAGMMECKKALVSTEGDFDAAMDLLRKKGLKVADKKADRSTAEGRVYSYIHHNQKVGVLVEIACETDFVARGEDFTALCHDLCMHIAATMPSPVSVSADEVPSELVEDERNILLGSEDMAGKPDDIKEKIVDGRMDKFIKERALLSQEYVKDPSMSVEDRVKTAIGKLGENIKVSRFARFELGA